MMKHKEDAKELLKQHDLRKTHTRVDVLALLLERGYALSHADVEDVLQTEHDRVTLYRTLNSFEEQGLTHRVMGTDGVARYALCDNCEAGHHHDDHYHFQCTNCTKIYCIHQHIHLDLKVPKGFKMTNYSINVEGICDKCQ